MDVNTGRVLWSKNALVHRAPASLTKMAAAIVLIENGKLDDTVTAPDAVKGVPESSLHLSPGETISLHDLLYAMLLRSANDTPVAGSYYLSGSIPPFVKLMNDKAYEIGCRNTNFVTPNGLYAEGHYSCAYDLALIARYGLTHVPFFKEVVRTRDYRVTRSVHKGDSLVINTAKTFLSDFPGADGVKTGYISQAGHCFVGSATRNGYQLIAVSLNSPQCRSDVVQILSYGFAHFKPFLVYDKGAVAGIVAIGNRQEPVVTASNLYDVIEKGQGAFPLTAYSLHAAALNPVASEAIAAGDKVGTVVLYRGNKEIMAVDALATKAFPAVPAAEKRVGIGRTGGTTHVLPAIVLAVILLPLLYVGARILDIAIYARKITKNSRRRRTDVTEDVGAVDP
jgi:D-alanyl-D-alanine carboxypeptidase (penicillin-binding protein 5/6)